MASNTLTITFRAKRDEFAGGIGYKVPKLGANHVSVADRDMAGQTFLSGMANRDITDARLKNLLGGRLPGVVWEDASRNDTEWTVTPERGMFARISITVPMTVAAMRGGN